MGLLIDENGIGWPEHSPSLRSKYPPPPDGDFLSHVIAVHGAIHIKKHVVGVHVTLCPGAFNLLTLVSATHAMVFYEPRRVLLTALGAASDHRIFAGLWEFTEYAETIAKPGDFTTLRQARDQGLLANDAYDPTW